jgi:hypothetical protein
MRAISRYLSATAALAMAALTVFARSTPAQQRQCSAPFRDSHR